MKTLASTGDLTICEFGAVIATCSGKAESKGRQRDAIKVQSLHRMQSEHSHTLVRARRTKTEAVTTERSKHKTNRRRARWQHYGKLRSTARVESVSQPRHRTPWLRWPRWGKRSLSSVATRRRIQPV